MKLQSHIVFHEDPVDNLDLMLSLNLPTLETTAQEQVFVENLNEEVMTKQDPITCNARFCKPLGALIEFLK